MIIAIIYYSFENDDTINDYNIIDQDPEQSETYRSQIIMDDYVLTPVKDYSIKARVLRKEKYIFDKNSGFSNFDLALGWNKMSDIENLKKIKITQANRFYYWRVDSFFISRDDIEHNSSNHHIIHANKSVYNTLKNIDKYNIIEMEGYLVNVQDKNDSSKKWKSSLTRTDTGGGACEIFYVENIKIIN